MEPATKTIDVSDLSESARRHLERLAASLREQVLAKRGAPKPEFRETLGDVHGTLSREEIYSGDDE